MKVLLQRLHLPQRVVQQLPLIGQGQHGLALEQDDAQLLLQTGEVMAQVLVGDIEPL